MSMQVHQPYIESSVTCSVSEAITLKAICLPSSCHLMNNLNKQASCCCFVFFNQEIKRFREKQQQIHVYLAEKNKSVLHCDSDDYYKRVSIGSLFLHQFSLPKGRKTQIHLTLDVYSKDVCFTW